MPYRFIKSKWVVRLVYIFVLFGLLFLMMKASFDIHFMSFECKGFILNLKQIPFILIGGLFGYFLALNAYLIVFVTALFVRPEEAYLLTPFMVTIFLFSMMSHYRWFRTKRDSIMAFITSYMANFLFEVLNNDYIISYDFSSRNIRFFQSHMVAPLCSCLIGCIFFYLFFNYMPDFIKSIFPLGYMYTREFVQNLVFQNQIKKTKISVKITTLIILEAILLGAFSIVFISVLFSDLRQMMNDGVRISQRIGDEMRFRYNNYGLAFTIKLLFMELSIAVPIASNINLYTKTMMGSPIGILSANMLKFADTTDESRAEYLQTLQNKHFNTHDEITDLYYSTMITLNEVTGYIERIQEEQRLKEDLRVAEAASEAKSAFLSNMSHEIRTPINAVLGMNEMILRESSDTQTLQYANTIQSAGTTLLSLVNDILDFSKIEAGKMEILPVQYNLSSMINDLLNMISKKAEDKNLELKIEIDESVPDLLRGDEIRIKQCATNVLTNAVKYTHEGSVTLGISYEKTDDDHIALKVDVRDTGIGIKEEDLNKLYSPFERIEEIRNRTIEGTGLGMSIVKKLLAMMDSRLVVESVYGEGSDFSFTVIQEVISWDAIGDFQKRYKEVVSSREKYTETFHAPDAHILVVDDTRMNLTVIVGLLKKTGIQVDTAECGRTTLEMVKKKKYDVIFLDHRMPEMDGIETFRAMKDLPGNLNLDTTCIALTANAVAGARETYIQEGFADYLSKPIDAARLEKMLIDYLPEDKVILPDDPRFEETAVIKGKEDDEEGKTRGSAESDGTGRGGRLDKYNNIDGLDLEEAVRNCGDEDLTADVIEDFAINLPEKIKLIDEYEKSGDINNYTIQVHALKSSARIIGATELSKKAEYLEKCGNDNEVTEIADKTPEVLRMLKALGKSLGVCSEEKDEHPEIPEEDLKSAFRDIRELMEVFDYDNAAGIYKMLSDYRIPEPMKEKYELAGKYIAAVDREKLLELL